MSLSGKITTISCRIDLRAIEPVSNIMIFRPLYRMVVSFMLRKDSISLTLAITRSGSLMKTNAHVPFIAQSIANSFANISTSGCKLGCRNLRLSDNFRTTFGNQSADDRRYTFLHIGWQWSQNVWNWLLKVGTRLDAQCHLGFIERRI